MQDEEERLPDPGPRPEEPPKENSGEYLWRVLKPAGAILVLLLFVVYLVFCFTYRGAPPEAAEPTEAAVTAAITE